MRKYWVLFGLSCQKQLEVRSDFLFERTRSFCILFSLYFLWTSLLGDQDGLLGYSRNQLITYVFVMTFLRAWVLGCVTDRIPSEISKGKITDILLRPISNLGFWASQDAANKAISVVSAFFEVSLFVWITSAPFLFPEKFITWFFFFSSTVLAMIIYFQMSYLLGVMGFWTAQSWGPRFCFEITLEFCSGAYFPIDLLPTRIQQILAWLPFPYLVFFPVSIYLGRASTPEILQGLGIQVVWVLVLSVMAKGFWGMGLRRYAAEGG